MALSDVIQVNITTQAAAVQQPGFGVPMVLGDHTVFTDLFRAYTSLAGMVTDGFSTTSPEYLAAQAILDQNPAVPVFLVGRRALRVARVFTIVPTPHDNTVYSFKLNGQLVTFTSGAGATATSIVTGLTAAVNALSISGLTVSGSTTLILTMTTGTWLHVDSTLGALPTSPALLAFDQTNTDPGVATDLAAIALATAGNANDFYGFMLTSASNAEVLAAAAWAESNHRQFIQAILDSDTINIAPSSQTGTAKTAQTDNYSYTGLLYHPDNGVFADAGWLGKVYPYSPGSVNFKFKALAGVPTYTLTATQQANCEGVNCNHYQNLAGVPTTSQGVASSGQFLDVVRDTDWFKSRLQNRIFTLLSNNPKVPFTDDGIQSVVAEVRGQIQEGIGAGFLNKNPKTWSVTFPQASQVSLSDKGARRLTGVSFIAELAGAVNKVVLNGTISL